MEKTQWKRLNGKDSMETRERLRVLVIKLDERLDKTIKVVLSED